METEEGGGGICVDPSLMIFTIYEKERSTLIPGRGNSSENLVRCPASQAFCSDQIGTESSGLKDGACSICYLYVYIMVGREDLVKHIGRIISEFGQKRAELLAGWTFWDHDLSTLFHFYFGFFYISETYIPHTLDGFPSWRNKS